MLLSYLYVGSYIAIEDPRLELDPTVKPLRTGMQAHGSTGIIVKDKNASEPCCHRPNGDFLLAWAAGGLGVRFLLRRAAVC